MAATKKTSPLLERQVETLTKEVKALSEKVENLEDITKNLSALLKKNIKDLVMLQRYVDSNCLNSRIKRY